MNRECRTGLSRIKNPGALPGQAPETGTPCRVLLSQALPVLLPPVLGFFAGFVLLGALTGRESLGILGGFTGCFLAALGVYLLRRGSPQK
jgi:positive regulator of sigma E activity